MTRNRTLRVGLGLVVVAAVAYFFAIALRRNWDATEGANLTMGWWVLSALLAFVAAVAVSGVIWGGIVARISGTHPGVTESVRVHSASWLLKYVPGQVGFVVNKVVWGQRKGLSKTMVLISVAYENVFLLIGSIVPTLAILMLAQTAGLGADPSLWWWVAVAVLPLAVALAPPVFRRCVRLVARLTIKRDVAGEHFLTLGQTWRFQLLYLIPRVMNGVGVVVIASAIVAAPVHTWVALGAAYIVAGALGILAIFVPSGLGVREAAFAAFAAPFIGLEMAIVVAITARIVATVADAGVAAIYGLTTAMTHRGSPHD